jgi:hypothetical protein
MRKSPVWPLVTVALVMLSACATPEVRPELAVITSPVDDVWVMFVEVAKESGFEFTVADPSRRVIKAAKDSTFVIGGAPDPMGRFGKAVRQQHHELKVSMRPRDDLSTAIEIAYTIDQVPDEDAGFAVLNTVRERIALQAR